MTARTDPAVKRAIATIPDDACVAIEYTDAIFETDAGRWVSTAEVAEAAEVPFTAFTSRKKAEHILGRLVVRRTPELNREGIDQPTLFDTHRFHGFFTRSDLDIVTADKTHRGHAIIEQVNADLKKVPRPSGIRKIHRERSLARPCDDGLRPHPRRRNGHRNSAGQSDHSDDPQEDHHHPGKDRVLRTEAHTAPAGELAMGNGLANTFRREQLRTTGASTT